MSDTSDTAVDAEEAAPTPPPERYGVLADESGERLVLHPTRDQWLDLARALLADGFTMGLDLTAVDYLTYKGNRPLPEGVAGERFEVVAAFADIEGNRRLWAKVQLPADDPAIASLTTFYPGLDFLEREVYDMFGIEFIDHPDLSRILMPESWQGHPLRKDYAIGAIPVQFKGAPGAR
ncbi:MAG: NADH-quinone oxidoreductase subunit C [Acidimicrobiales bacterium]